MAVRGSADTAGWETEFGDEFAYLVERKGGAEGIGEEFALVRRGVTGINVY